MNERDIRRIYGVDNTIPVGKLGQNETWKPMEVELIKFNYKYEIKDYGVYVKKECVDYDAVIYISSYNRYTKLLRLLRQLFTQKSKYTFKVVLMNDGSTELEYDSLNNEFPNVMYLKNEVNGGKCLYWKTINSILNEVEKIDTHAVIQIDDDFILCDNFLNNIMTLFFEVKKANNAYMGIRYHSYSFNKNLINKDDSLKFSDIFCGFDGGSLFDVQFLKMFNYKLDEVNPEIFKHKFQHSQVWTMFNNFIFKFGAAVYTTNKSLVIHDGNDDSKMHFELRKTKKIYTKDYIDDLPTE